jgi:hypothetical protein
MLRSSGNVEDDAALRLKLINDRFNADPVWLESPFPMRCDSLYIQRVLDVMLEGKDAACALLALREEPQPRQAIGDTLATDLPDVHRTLQQISTTAGNWLQKFSIAGALRLRDCAMSSSGVIFYCKLFVDEALRTCVESLDDKGEAEAQRGSYQAIHTAILKARTNSQTCGVDALFQIHRRVTAQCTAMCPSVGGSQVLLEWRSLVDSPAPGDVLVQCMHTQAAAMQSHLWALLQVGVPSSGVVNESWNVPGEDGAAFRLLTPTAKVIVAVENTARVHGCLSSWGHLVSRRRVVVCSSAADCAALLGKTFFAPRLAQREPHSDVRCCFETLVYSFHMPLHERAQYLQTFPDQSSETPMITIMNNVIPPEQIREWQRHLNGWSLCSVFADSTHPFAQLCRVAVFACRFQDMFHTSFMDRFWVAGYHTQDRIERMNQAEHYGHPRDPLILCLFGHWFVAQGTDLLVLCQSPCEAIAVWLLLLYTLRGNKLADGLQIGPFQKMLWTSPSTPADSLLLSCGATALWSDAPAIKACVAELRAICGSL